MANVRIKDLTTTAATTASDDFFGVDGATNGTRKLNAYSPTFGGNLAVNGTGSFGGATGPHTFGNGAGAVEVRAVGDSSGYYGYSFYTGGSYESSLKHTSGSGILKLDVGRNSAWGGSFEIYADTTRAARFAKTSTTLDGNLTVSGTGNSSVLGNLAIGQSTNAANARLNVLGANNAGIRVDQGSYNYHAAFEHIFSSLSYTTEYARIKSNGNLLLGTTTDGGEKLQVSGTAAISGALSIGNTVQTAASVASTHKVTISIGGSTYYLLATNV